MQVDYKVRHIAKACGRAKPRHRTRMVLMPSDVGTRTTRKKNRGITYGDAYLNLATTYPRRRKTFTGGLRGGIRRHHEQEHNRVIIDPELGREILRLTRVAEKRLSRLGVPMARHKYYLRDINFKAAAFSNLQRLKGVRSA